MRIPEDSFQGAHLVRSIAVWIRTIGGGSFLNLGALFRTLELQLTAESSHSSIGDHEQH